MTQTLGWVFAVHRGQLVCARARQQVCSSLYFHSSLPKSGLFTTEKNISHNFHHHRLQARAADYKDQLRSWIIGNGSACQHNIFIFDEVRCFRNNLQTREFDWRDISGWQDALWGVGCSEAFPWSLWSYWWCGLQVIFTGGSKMSKFWSCTERTSSSSWATLGAKKLQTQLFQPGGKANPEKKYPLRRYCNIAIEI